MLVFRWYNVCHVHVMVLSFEIRDILFYFVGFILHDLFYTSCLCLVPVCFLSSPVYH